MGSNARLVGRSILCGSDAVFPTANVQPAAQATWAKIFIPGVKRTPRRDEKTRRTVHRARSVIIQFKGPIQLLFFHAYNAMARL